MASRTLEQKVCASVFDHTNPESVYGRAPQAVRDAMDSIPEYLHKWSFKQLEKKHGHRITQRDQMLKVKFWQEYQHALDLGATMSPSAIIRGICASDYFYKILLKTPWLLMWLLHPLPNYEASMLAGLHKSTAELLKILELPLVDDKGRANSVAINAKIKVHQIMENRVMGLAPQTVNINQKTLQVNARTEADPLSLGAENIDKMNLSEVLAAQRTLELEEAKQSEILDAELAVIESVPKKKQKIVKDALGADHKARKKAAKK